MLTNTKIILYGAGGHGKVVLDALTLGDVNCKSLLIVDDNINLYGQKLFDFFISPVSCIKDLTNFRFHISIGNNSARSSVFKSICKNNNEVFTIAHPKASISKYANIGVGSFLGANSVIAPNASIGVGVIVNHGAIVDHDCFIGDFSHIAPTVCLGGGVVVGCKVLVGAGSVILPGIIIGDGAVIGAGSVVTSNVPPFSVALGVPAKIIKEGIILE